MEIFWRLILSHLIADFTLQTDYINRLKRRSKYGVIIHILIHFIVSSLILMPYLDNNWFDSGFFRIKGFSVIIILTFFHLMVDKVRIYIIDKNIYPDNTLNFIIDQLFHFYFIFLFTPFKDLNPYLCGEKVIMISSFLVIVSHTTTVLIYYIEKDLKGLGFPGFDQKYLMIFERVVIWAFFMLEGWWWSGFVVLWILQLYYLKRKRIIDITEINFWLSILISIICGIITRYCYYL